MLLRSWNGIHICALPSKRASARMSEVLEHHRCYDDDAFRSSHLYYYLHVRHFFFLFFSSFPYSFSAHSQSICFPHTSCLCLSSYVFMSTERSSSGAAGGPPTYGSIPSSEPKPIPSRSHHAFSRLLSSTSNDDCSLRGGSDLEENARCGKRSTIAERKRRRMHKHHHAGSASRLLLPSFMAKHRGNSSKSSSSESTSSSNANSDSEDTASESEESLAEPSSTNLVLPALDPK